MLIFAYFLKGGVVVVHLSTHYRGGSHHPKNQVRFSSDPLRPSKIENGPRGTFLPISFYGGMESKNGINKCCSECHFHPQNRGGGSSDPYFGSKNGFLGTWRGGQLLFSEGLLHFPARWSVSLYSSEG